MSLRSRIESLEEEAHFVIEIPALYPWAKTRRRLKTAGKLVDFQVGVMSEVDTEAEALAEIAEHVRETPDILLVVCKRDTEGRVVLAEHDPLGNVVERE